MAQRPIYLDYNATTPLDPRVLEAMIPWLTERFGNPASSSHAFGWEAEIGIKHARQSLARSIGASAPEEVIFTSGATESLNLALQGVFRSYASKGRHFIAAATEHKAVLDTLQALHFQGAEVTILPVDDQGMIHPGTLQKALRPDTLAVAMMLANNETGIIQDIPALSRITHEAGALFLCDATQAFGKIPVQVETLGADLLAASAHKIFGPKGVGLLYVRRRNPRVSLTPLLFGGGHERGFRSGTLNVPGIVGFQKAAEIAVDSQESETIRLKALRDMLEIELVGHLGVRIHGAHAPRLPHVSNFEWPGKIAENTIRKLPRLALSTGSACSSALKSPSHVLLAMGRTEKEAFSSFRISLGRMTTEAEIDEVIRLWRELA